MLSSLLCDEATKYSSVFDIIAEIVICILETNEEYDIVSDYICSKSPRESIENLLGIEMDSMDLSQSVLSSIDDFSRFSFLVEKFRNDKKYFELLNLLQQLESDFVENPLLWSTNNTDDILLPLNECFQDRVLLLPRLHNKNEWSRSIDNLSYTINNLLSTILVIDVASLHGFRLVNHRIDVSYSGKQFLVGGSPVTKYTQLSVDEDESQDINYMMFKVGYQDEARFINDLIEITRYADEHEISLLVFPELISNRTLNQMIEERLELINFAHLKLIAFPSYYDEEAHSNIGGVYFTEEKQMLFEQQKSFSFVSDNHETKKEYLSRNRELHILHIEGVGRIVFPICKDMLVDKYMDVCKAVRANLVVTRSYSPGLRNYIYFYRIIMGYTSFDCNGFWLNSCNYNSDGGDRSECVIALTCASKHDLGGGEDSLHKCQRICEHCLVSFKAN